MRSPTPFIAITCQIANTHTSPRAKCKQKNEPKNGYLNGSHQRPLRERGVRDHGKILFRDKNEQGQEGTAEVVEVIPVFAVPAHLWIMRTRYNKRQHGAGQEENMLRARRASRCHSKFVLRCTIWQQRYADRSDSS